VREYLTSIRCHCATPSILQAAIAGHDAVVKELIKQGAEVRIPYFDNGPLFNVFCRKRREGDAIVNHGYLFYFPDGAHCGFKIPWNVAVCLIFVRCYLCSIMANIIREQVPFQLL
jgi:hypothetical protein